MATQRDKAFFDTKRREMSEAEAEKMVKEQEALNAMTDEERAEYLANQERARVHEAKKDRMLVQQLSGYGSSSAVGRGGRGRGAARSLKQRHSVSAIPTSISSPTASIHSPIQRNNDIDANNGDDDDGNDSDGVQDSPILPQHTQSQPQHTAPIPRKSSQSEVVTLPTPLQFHGTPTPTDSVISPITVTDKPNTDRITTGMDTISSNSNTSPPHHHHSNTDTLQSSPVPVTPTATHTTDKQQLTIDSDSTVASNVTGGLTSPIKVSPPPLPGPPPHDTSVWDDSPLHNANSVDSASCVTCGKHNTPSHTFTFSGSALDISTPDAIAVSFSGVDENVLRAIQCSVAALLALHDADKLAAHKEIDDLKKQLDSKSATIATLTAGLSEKDRQLRAKESELILAQNAVKSKDAKLKQLEMDLAHAVALKRSSEAAAANATKLLAESESKATEAHRQHVAVMTSMEASLSQTRVQVSTVQAAMERQAVEHEQLLQRLKEDAKGVEAGLQAEIRALKTSAEELKLESSALHERLMEAMASIEQLNVELQLLGTRRLEGQLSKMGGRWKAWKKRTFVLCGPAIQYYDGGDLKGCITLLPSSSVVQDTDIEHNNPDAAITFKVVGSAGGKSYLLKARSEAEKVQWMDEITRVVTQLQRMMALGSSS